jgi:hypothetical protein
MKTILLRFSLFSTLLAATGIIMAAPMTPPVRSLVIPATNAVISIDGVADADYSSVQSTTAFNVTGSTGADADYTLTFQVCYNYQKLFLVAKILDDYASVIEYTTDPDPWTMDCIEVFLSLDTTGTTAAYDSNTIQLRFNRGIQDSAQTPGRAAQEDYQVYYEDVADGWVLEVGIPWTAVLQEGAVPEDIEAYLTPIVNGFDISGIDNDTDGPDAHDSQTAWDDDDPAMPDASEDLAWNDRTKFGIMSLESAMYGPPYIELSPDLAKFKAQVVFPNPSNNYIQFRNVEPACTITIFNSIGLQVLEASNINAEDYLDISSLKSGIYWAIINNDEVLRFVKE